MAIELPQYDASYYQQWEKLEKEAFTCDAETIQRFAVGKRQALDLATSLKERGVSPTHWMQRMAEKTAELACIVQNGRGCQDKFHQEQTRLNTEERSYREAAADSGIKKVQEAAESFFATTAGGLLGGALTRSSGAGMLAGAIVGLGATLVKQIIADKTT